MEGHEVYNNTTMANLINIKLWSRQFEDELYNFTPLLKCIDMVTKSDLPYGNEYCFTIAARPKLGNTTKMVCGGMYVCKSRIFEQCTIKVNCWRTHSFAICKKTMWQSIVDHVKDAKKTVLEEMRMDISYDILCLLFDQIQLCTPKSTTCMPEPTLGSHFLPSQEATVEALDQIFEMLSLQGVPLGGEVKAFGSIRLINKLMRLLEGQCTLYCKPGEQKAARNAMSEPLANSTNIMRAQFEYQGVDFYALEFAGQDPGNKICEGDVHYLYVWHKSAIKAAFQKEIGIEGPFRDAKGTDYVWQVDACYGLKLYSCSRALVAAFNCPSK